MFLIGVKFWELLGGIEMAMVTLYLVAMGVRQVRVFVGVVWGRCPGLLVVVLCRLQEFLLFFWPWGPGSCGW